MSDLDEIERRVRGLARPPVRVATTVRSDVAHSFDAFVRSIGTWWPAQPFSAGKHRVTDITIEPRLGGGVFETWDDATVVRWGEITAWSPPAMFSMSWLCTPRPTQVELRFTELGPGLTRVTVEHRGWEALSDEELAADCALPGGYTGGAYSRGWERILEAFAAAPAAPPAAAAAARAPVQP